MSMYEIWVHNSTQNYCLIRERFVKSAKTKELSQALNRNQVKYKKGF